MKYSRAKRLSRSSRFVPTVHSSTKNFAVLLNILFFSSSVPCFKRHSPVRDFPNLSIPLHFRQIWSPDELRLSNALSGAIGTSHLSRSTRSCPTLFSSNLLPI